MENRNLPSKIPYTIQLAGITMIWVTMSKVQPEWEAIMSDLSMANTAAITLAALLK